MGAVGEWGAASEAVLPYVPQLLRGWAHGQDDDRHVRVTGTLAFVDIAGFTRLTERLARKGNVGAEEMSDLLSATFADLLSESYEDGADLVKWGGDAMLLLFRGAGHAPRAARAAHRMRARLRVVGRLATSSGRVTLRMSAGVHSGDFDFFLVGDPAIHRELLIGGPAATATAETEAATSADQVGLSGATAALLDAHVLGGPLGDGRLLRTAPSRLSPPAARQLSGGPDPVQLLPVPIRRLLLSGAVEAEHRLITVAFVQYSGTDQLLLSSGALVLAEALDEVVRNVQVACADHDVTFFETDINRDGGKIMLTAGAPRSADHDEQRMLLVARAVLDRAGQLPLRIGINRGHVFSGDFGAPFRRTYSVKGDAINLAARVMAKAGPGQALATMEVVNRSRTVFRTTELPPFTVKGKSDAVLAADVGERLGVRDERRRSAPLLGRTAELAALEQAVVDARAGRGRLVEIVGAPGMGRSRLVAEVLAARDDVHVVMSPCEEYEASTPYFPFRRVVRDLLGVRSDAGPVEAAEVLTRRVSETAPDLLPWLPLLGIPMDLQLPPTRETLELDDQFRKARLEDVVLELLGSVLAKPTAVVIEDTQLMDAASVDLLQRLGDGLEGSPLLVVMTRRDQPSAFAHNAATPLTTITLEPLSPVAATELVRAMSGDRPLTPQAASELVERGGGNPMFLEALSLEAGRAGAAGRLPESVEGLVTSQMDRLAPTDRTVVRYAAVFGTVIDERALDLLLQTRDAEVPRGAMGRLVNFLERDEDGRLRFRNVLIREVAYQALPFSRRRALHDHVGQALEMASATPERHCELLSSHFFHAGRHEQAWRYSLLAGERALAKHAHGEAIQFFSRAAQSAPYVTGVGNHEVARVYERLADSRWLVGMTQEAADAYAAARRNLRGDPVRLAGIIEKEARIDHRRRKHSVALRRISIGLNGLRDVPGPRAGVARSLLSRRYAHSRFNQGRIDEALHWADLAAQEAEQAVDKDALAQAYEMLNFVYASSGRDEPLPYGRIALQAYVELDNLSRQAHCLNNLAMQEYNDAQWEQSLILLRRASEIFHRTGDTAAEANALYNQVELLVRQRRPADAGRLLPDVLRIARAVEDDELVALAVREQARTAALAGDVAEAMALLEQARAMFADLGEPAQVRTTDITRAEVLVGAGLAGEAGEVLDSVTDTADPPGATVDRLLGRHHLADGRLAEARVVLEAGLDTAERTGDRYEKGLLMLALAELARREGAPDAALVDAAREVLDPMGVREPRDARTSS